MSVVIRTPTHSVVLVSAELQEKYPIGSIVPYSVLLDLELFPRPSESTIPAPFTAGRIILPHAKPHSNPQSHSVLP
jgi:hypothetical protein